MKGYARVEQSGSIYSGFLDQGQFYPLEGDLFGKHQIKSQALTGSFKILAPLIPIASYAIGLNYRDHAEEVGAKLPDRPVVLPKCSTPCKIRKIQFSFQSRQVVKKWTMNAS